VLTRTPAGRSRLAGLGRLAVVFLLALPGCVWLPEFGGLPAEPPGRLRVVGAQGAVAVEPSARLSALGSRPPPMALARHLAYVEALTGAPLYDGNQAAVLVDGPATHGAMLRAIAAARDHVNLEVFVFADDAVGRAMADALLRKQSEGVQVNVIYDSLGSRKTSRAFFERLAAGGIALVEFNPIDQGLVAYGHRDHRKILVVDGRVAITGGINLAAAYGLSSAAFRRKEAAPSLATGWRDTSVEIRGPAVAAFQQLFLETWRSQHGPTLAARRYFPHVDAPGDAVVRVIGSGPRSDRGAIYLTLLSAIANATRSAYLTTAFFVPDRQLLDALTLAARRGVDVRLLVPGFTDHPVVQAAGRSHYAELLRAGVAIYEERSVLLHAKTAVVDGVWSTIGSANLDPWSFVRNEEVTAAVLGQEVGSEMQALFEADIALATRITAEAWTERPLSARLLEAWARLWAGIF
jgi:cardiolipin synthase